MVAVVVWGGGSGAGDMCEEDPREVDTVSRPGDRGRRSLAGVCACLHQLAVSWRPDKLPCPSRIMFFVLLSLKQIEY